jgi:hypothetical protein
MVLMRADTLCGPVGEGWALEIESFLGPVNWHPADRRVPFGAQKTLALNVHVSFNLFLGASGWTGDENITQEDAVGPAGPHLPLSEHRLRQLHPYQVETVLTLSYPEHLSYLSKVTGTESSNTS